MKTKNNIGFTLIEMLVVVLIIGILAAIALPQYQKAVEKSKSAQVITLLKSIAQSAQLFYMTHNVYPKSFDDIDVDIPWTGRTHNVHYTTDSRANEDWSFEIEAYGESYLLYVWRISGKYQGAGFIVVLNAIISPHLVDEEHIKCFEREHNSSGGLTFDSNLSAGAYCEDVIGGRYFNKDSSLRIYYLQ